jgi:hypothetical protein
MLGGIEAHPPTDLVDRALQRGVLEGDHPAAVAADRVVVVLAVWLDPLIAGDAACHFEPAEHAELLKLLKGAVDARAADGWLATAQLVV